MLNIFYGEKTTDDNGRPTTKGKNLSWKRGDPQPKLPILASKCVIVEASFDELNYIQNRFSNIPWVDGATNRCIVWTGDDARFIAVNLVD